MSCVTEIADQYSWVILRGKEKGGGEENMRILNVSKLSTLSVSEFLFNI